jgi:adenylate cyclase class IV
MGFRHREIELKFILKGLSLNEVQNHFDLMLKDLGPIRRHGSSADTYWTNPSTMFDAQFARVRERDGIRQLTVKGKDKGSNLNRIEIDLDCTSDTRSVHKFFRALLGKPSGVVTKSYFVWELESEYDTVTAYTVDDHKRLENSVVIEVEAKTEAAVNDLSQKVLDYFAQLGDNTVERAPGSLFEMLITKEC